jgi:hypothetical protein
VGEPTYTHSLQLSGPALTTPPTGYSAFRVLDDRRPRGSGARLGQWAAGPAAGGNSWDVPFSLFSASRAPASDRRIACSVWLRLLADGRPTAGRRQADGRPTAGRRQADGRPRRLEARPWAVDLRTPRGRRAMSPLSPRWLRRGPGPLRRGHGSTPSPGALNRAVRPGRLARPGQWAGGRRGGRGARLWARDRLRGGGGRVGGGGSDRADCAGPCRSGSRGIGERAALISPGPMDTVFDVMN